MECLVFKTVARTGVADNYVRDVVFFILKKLKKEKGELSVHFIGDAKMKSLNTEYRGKKSTTDVLSFVAQEGSFVSNDSNELGDIFISIPQIQRQSREHNIKYREELTRMLVHGVLHLLGYDHIKKSEADKMFSLQESLTKQFL